MDKVEKKKVGATDDMLMNHSDLKNMSKERIHESGLEGSPVIDVLDYISELRNGRSSCKVRIFTEILLRQLIQKTSRYTLSETDISRIILASATRDIGKIMIPDAIINKPGRLTEEEFLILKKHTLIGADIMKRALAGQNISLFQTAYEICRWHHERYDGRGYPDKLKGEEIPISAQIVALADVYDALAGERADWRAYSHETSVRMMLNGEVGAFNPLLLECLSDAGERIREEMQKASDTIS